MILNSLILHHIFKKNVKRMKSLSIKLMVLFSLYSILSCNQDDDADNHPYQTYTFTFDDNAEDWEAGFSDYSSDWEVENLEFVYEHSSLPEQVNIKSKSLLISGRNLSDDLFMFIKRKFTGLKPNHSYLIRVQIELASQYPEQSVGIGGSPGASVYSKGWRINHRTSTRN
jgi:hypothetical protein